MPDPRVEALEQQIADLSRDFTEFNSRVTEDLRGLRASVDEANGHTVDILYEIGGAPDSKYRDTNRPTLRSRLHNLENDREAARIATAALESAEKSRKLAEGQVFTRLQKVGLFTFAFVGCLLAIINSLGGIT